MVLQRGVDFAGHVSRETGDAAAAHRRPFRVRAGENAQSVRDAGAEDLCFLAAHHVGDAVSLGHKARHDLYRPEARRIDRDTPRRHVGEPRRTRHIGRLDPALAAPDHAGEQDACFGILHPPRPDHRCQRVGEVAVHDGKNTAIAALAKQRRAGVRNQRGAARRGAPIDGDQGHGPNTDLSLSLVGPCVRFIDNGVTEMWPL